MVTITTYSNADQRAIAKFISISHCAGYNTGLPENNPF